MSALAHHRRRLPVSVAKRAFEAHQDERRRATVSAEDVGKLLASAEKAGIITTREAPAGKR